MTLHSFYLDGVYATNFLAPASPDTWNGFPVPMLTAEQTTTLAWALAYHDRNRTYTATVEHGVLIWQEDGEVVRITPDHDGLFAANYGLTWTDRGPARVVTYVADVTGFTDEQIDALDTYVSVQLSEGADDFEESTYPAVNGYTRTVAP